MIRVSGRIFSVLTALFLIAASCFAQQSVTPCSLTLTQAPSVRGIGFGMTREEAEKTLGLIFLSSYMSKEDEKSGLSNLHFFRNRVNKYPQQLDGVEAIQLKLLDNKIYSFIFSFDNSTKWNDINQFALSLSENLNLPKSWRASGFSLTRMDCQDFRVEANIYFLPEISLTNLSAVREIEARRREFRAKEQPGK